jgi:hypothetical protein
MRPNSERVLTGRELNRALLARQLLLEPSDLPLARAIEQVGCLQTQYSPSGYIGLWSRLRDFRRESLTEALEDRSVVQATMMRSTIHLASAADYPLLIEGARSARAEWLTRTLGRQLDGIDMNAVAAAAREMLAGGPLRATEIQARLAALGYPRLAWVSVGGWLDMVRVPPSGTWERRKADLFGLADQWLAGATGGGAGEGATVANPARAEAGLELLVRRYLGGFGPAPVEDVGRWAGVPATVVGPMIERLDLRRFRDEQGRVLVDLPDAPLPDPATPAPVRFLPTWDATLLAHARRTGILPEARRPLVFDTRTPHSVPTFLVDGVAAGSWRYEDATGRISLSPFEPLPAATMAELEPAAERLAAFHAG